ncbi:hypothetical protein PACTADRAFT_2386 [Pachysolen tannophilus NRRL Y-2460]|uniref:U3 small nucleolar RNA-associated protein 8 n=1 Tax=Pachysolen tannophilus NRRL Y-2460 TaxID=669874 RepID=A0A1E4TWE9_PACTA|nr:hypothetical protein PACTADRAFT_2386 [Pachysolen tannophilus NRRL Y-2460]
MPSILDPYSITGLPRISTTSSDDGFSSLCAISEISNKDTPFIDLAIDGSIIGTYILRPTPKLVWSFAISPITVVDCLDSFNTVEDGESDKVVVCVSERKKKFFILIEKLKTDSDDINVKSEKILITGKKIIGLKFSNNGDSFYSISENGQVGLYDFKFEGDETKKIDPISFIEGTSKTSKVLFHKFMKTSQSLDIAKAEGYLLSLEYSNKNFNFKVYALLNDKNILEMSNSTLSSLSKLNLDSLKIIYDPSGNLIILDIINYNLFCFKIPTGELMKKISLANKLSNFPQNREITLLVPAPNRLLLAINNTIFLIELKHEAILDTYTTSSPSSVLALLQCPFVKGNSLNTKESNFFVLNKNMKNGSVSLKNFSIDVGYGNLADCLGKGINRVTEYSDDKVFFQNEVKAFTDLIKIDSNKAQLQEEDTIASGELYQLYCFLKESALSADVARWESIFVPYMKTSTKSFESLRNEIKDSSLHKIDNQKQDFKIFELENDRIIDSKFIYKIVSLIFKRGEDGKLALYNSNFVPEATLTYLLTHPLFPTEFTKGLLQSLNRFPRLIRQAIVTCPNLSCLELIQQLDLIENNEIFKDLVVRLVEEYSSEKITQETMKIMNSNNQANSETTNNGSFDLDKIIGKIIRLNFGFEILNSFIDSNGLILSLHYSKNESNLEKFINKIDYKINSLLVNSQLLTLVNQSLINANELSPEIGNNTYIKKSKKTKKNKKKAEQAQELKRLEQNTNQTPLTISENINETKMRLESMLTIDKKNDHHGGLFKNNTINGGSGSFDKKVPSYSVEKLII